MVEDRITTADGISCLFHKIPHIVIYCLAARGVFGKG